jgi:hypothetical protein
MKSKECPMWMQWIAAGGVLAVVALRLVVQWFDRPSAPDRRGQTEVMGGV